MNRYAVLCVLAISAGCTADPIANVPASLHPGRDAALAAVVPAKGVQIYECRAAKGGAGVYQWAFVAPDAMLYDRSGKPIGRHGAGPYWMADDGSRVEGSVKARADSPRADAIPWLLLDTHSAGPEGAFSKVTSIQRLNTVGGTAPATGCSPDTSGRQVRVGYTADYYLYTRR